MIPARFDLWWVLTRLGCAAASRPVYVGGWHDTPIYRREELVPGHGFAGPAVIEQTDTTTLVEPGLSVAVDTAGNLLVGAR